MSASGKWPLDPLYNEFKYDEQTRMQYEVEQKFPVDDLPAVETRLLELGAEPCDRVVQVDTYFAHPTRDFAATDEALRIRQVDECNFVTYKGPKIDAETKTRREVEVPLADGESQADAFAQLLEAVGFTPVAKVQKTRRTLSIAWQEHTLTAALDDVAGLGTFVELELIAEENELDAAKSALAGLVERLGLGGSERRSYLELLQSRKAGE